MIALFYYFSLVLQLIGCSQSTISDDQNSASATAGLEIDVYQADYQKLPSYQNDHYPIQNYELSIGIVQFPEKPVPYLSTLYVGARKFRLISSLTSFSLILVLMLHVHDICWSPKMFIPLLITLILTAIPMLLEASFTVLGFFDICDSQGKVEKGRTPINAIKMLVSLFIAGLQVARVASALTPIPPYETIFEELCTWKGDTLFTSPKWSKLVFTPSVILVVIPILEILVGHIFPNYLNEKLRK